MTKSPLPPRYQRFRDEQPRIVEAYEALGEATLATGPLDRRTAELVKLGIAVGARLEGAVHAHARRALDAGASADEVRHAVRLALTTVGFPAMMAALTWVEDVLSADAG
jgi:4-carboxymuconolactone decarboxylase